MERGLVASHKLFYICVLIIIIIYDCYSQIGFKQCKIIYLYHTPMYTEIIQCHFVNVVTKDLEKFLVHSRDSSAH